MLAVKYSGSPVFLRRQFLTFPTRLTGLVGGQSVLARMRPVTVVVIDPAADARAELRSRFQMRSDMSCCAIGPSDNGECRRRDHLQSHKVRTDLEDCVLVTKPS